MMSHTEIYTINGRKYRYEITNYRVGKKVKHKKKYLGPVNPINKRTNPNAGRKPKLKVRICGLKPSHDSGVDVCTPCAQSTSNKIAQSRLAFWNS